MKNKLNENQNSFKYKGENCGGYYDIKCCDGFYCKKYSNGLATWNIVKIKNVEYFHFLNVVKICNVQVFGMVIAYDYNILININVIINIFYKKEFFYLIK